MLREIKIIIESQQSLCPTPVGVESLLLIAHAAPLEGGGGGGGLGLVDRERYASTRAIEVCHEEASRLVAASIADGVSDERDTKAELRRAEWYCCNVGCCNMCFW